MKKQLGFTLIEVLITLSISAILLAYAVPSFRGMIENNRIASMSNDFTSYIQLARSESLRRGLPVSICSSNNSTQTACGSNTTWNKGWIVFVDSNDDGAMASAADRIKIGPTLGTNRTITTSSGVMTFTASGFVSRGNTTYLLSSSGCTANNAKTLTLSTTGRISIAATACP
jgi:type IV fimbrial biogenesis protein FimT